MFFFDRRTVTTWTKSQLLLRRKINAKRESGGLTRVRCPFRQISEEEVGIDAPWYMNVRTLLHFGAVPILPRSREDFKVCVPRAADEYIPRLGR